MWIFNSFKSDFLKIYLSAIVFFLLFKLTTITGGEESVAFIIFNITLFSLSDVGHVYTTIVKTWFDPTEKHNSKQYILTPLLIASGIILWRYSFNFLYFWVFIVYYDVWHNLKQGYGVVKWYETLNKNNYPWTRFFYYGLTILPFGIFMFRTTPFSLFNYYLHVRDFIIHPEVIQKDILGMNLLFENSGHYYASILYFGFLNLYFLWELNNFLKVGKVEINRILAMIFYGGIYFYCFALSTNLMEFAALLIGSHGFPYMFMLYKRMNIIQTIKKHYGKMIIALLLLGATFDYFYRGVVEEQDNPRVLLDPSLGELLIIVLYLTPILTHFVWDSYLWKKGHPDSQKLFKN